MAEIERRNATTPRAEDLMSAEDIAEQMIQRSRHPEPKPEPEPQPERKTPVYNHEVKRRNRQMSVTFPTAEWGDAIRERAMAWGMRPSDFVTWCVSYAMASIENGEVQQPQGDAALNLIPLRAGGTFDLPWKPVSGD